MNPKHMTNITIIGTGYVGLVAGVCFAEVGNDVLCIDIDQSKVEKLSQGIPTIYEKRLKELLQRNIRAGRIRFSTNLKEGVHHGSVIFLALPTPPDEDGSADLSHVLKVATQIGPYLRSYTIIVNKSTVPVGTAAKVRKTIAATTNVPFDVVANPEFLREGLAIEDFMAPDRVVIGTDSERALRIMTDLYRPFVQDNGAPILTMDITSAELTKYAANAFLATKLSFINEIANLCDRVGANVDHIRVGIGADPRIGYHYLLPGIGYGGSCLPKDVKALRHISAEHGYDFQVIRAVETVNYNQRQKPIELLRATYSDLRGRKIAIWGLAFKPDTDDIREAPAISVIAALLAEQARVYAYDPQAMDNVREYVFGDKIHYGNNMYEVLDNADALLLLTEWQEFRDADLDRVRRRMASPVLIDGRNVFGIDTMEKAGFYYRSIGRPPVGVGNVIHA